MAPGSPDSLGAAGWDGAGLCDVGDGRGVRLGELLGDGMDARHASLWRRQLVFGPAPEFCLLSRDRSKLGLPAGVAPARLPEGWTASVFAREALWHG